MLSNRAFKLMPSLPPFCRTRDVVVVIDEPSPIYSEIFD